jgi:2-oxoglutarate dehydrogenase E2 component (dihydrolipoamide succinyltransferase)
MPDLVVPALGESITEAVISRWHKNVGDQVEVDEPVLALETDKITVDLPAPSAGSLAEQKFAEGATVRVGDVVGSISAGGEASAGAPTKQAKPEAEPPAKEAPAKATKQPAAKPETKPEAKPAAKPETKAEAKPETKAEAKPETKAEAQPTARAAAVATPSSPRAEAGNGQDGRRMSPSMRRAQREGTTSPPVAADRGAAASTPTAAATPAAPPAGTAPARAKAQVEQGKADPREDVVPMTPIRKRIAQRLIEAQQSSASLTTFNEVDMSRVMELRDRYKQEFVERHGVKLGFMSFFARAAVAALAEFPGLNAEVRGDTIVYKRHYDLGIAVQTDRGLMVPVLRDVDQLGFADIEKGIGELAARGRAGKLALDDLVGATFTITNGGIFGSMLSTPLLNYPQTGILGMHNIVERPVATGGTVHVRPIMYLALTYDHRVVDGREAVSFLVGIKQRIESPDRLLFDL